MQKIVLIKRKKMEQLFVMMVSQWVCFSFFVSTFFGKKIKWNSTNIIRTCIYFEIIRPKFCFWFTSLVWICYWSLCFWGKNKKFFHSKDWWQNNNNNHNQKSKIKKVEGQGQGKKKGDEQQSILLTKQKLLRYRKVKLLFFFFSLTHSFIQFGFQK